MKKYKVTIILSVLAAFLLLATPVYADTADPDGTPTADKYLWGNVIEPGDILLLIYANIPYATLPDTPVTETFIWRLMDVDGVTELGNTVGFAYNDDGYGYNVYSMYFSAADVAALGMVWGTLYTVRLSGNPAVFDTPPTYNYPLSAGDYSLLTLQADVQLDIATWILTVAGELDSRWGLTVSYSLLTENETATVLSIYGEAFFRGAIPGVQAMAPLAFSVVIRAISATDRTWNTTYTDNLTAQYDGTWIATSKAAGAALFGASYDLLSLIMMLVMCGGLLIGNIMITGDHWNGLVDVSVLGIVGARLAMYDFFFLILIAALCWIYIGMKVWFGMIR